MPRVVRAVALMLAGVWFAACTSRPTSDDGVPAERTEPSAARPVAAPTGSAFTTGTSSAAPASDRDPKVRDGDLIFHESSSGQSDVVRAVTRSRWTHMGVIFHEAQGPVVLEAVSPVRSTRLKSWIERGRGQKYVIKRLRNVDARLSPAVVSAMKVLGKAWLGKPYDLLFQWDDEALYCSELAYKLFDRAAHVRLGKLETVADMNLDDQRVRQEIRKRFANAQLDPSETVVTPDSIFHDTQLIQVSP